MMPQMAPQMLQPYGLATPPMMQSGNPDVTVTRTLAPKSRPNQLTTYGDAESFEHGRVHGDMLERPAHTDVDLRHTNQVYAGDDHPVVVTDTGSHAFAVQHGDEIVVGDEDGEGLSDQLSHELGELGSWFHGASFFNDVPLQ